MTETWQRRGLGIELCHLAPRAQVADPIAPTHDAQSQDGLTHVTWVDDLFLIAKNAKAQEMTSEVINTKGKLLWPQRMCVCAQTLDP